MGRIMLLVIGMSLLLCGGCVYTSAGGHPAVEEFPPPVWDESEKAFRQEFPAYSYYSRSGVYPPGTKLTPGGAHWGQVGDMIEGLAHLPTFWLEWALSAERKTDYDVVFLDRNSTRGSISLRAFPAYAFDDRLLRQEPFRPYWTNTVFGIDFAEGERIIAGKNASRKTIGEHRAWLLYLDKLENARPVLWWTDGAGVENLIVFQSPPAATIFEHASTNEYAAPWYGLQSQRSGLNPNAIMLAVSVNPSTGSFWTETWVSVVCSSPPKGIRTVERPIVESNISISPFWLVTLGS